MEIYIWKIRNPSVSIVVCLKYYKFHYVTKDCLLLTAVTTFDKLLLHEIRRNPSKECWVAYVSIWLWQFGLQRENTGHRRCFPSKVCLYPMSSCSIATHKHTRIFHQLTKNYVIIVQFVNYHTKVLQTINLNNYKPIACLHTVKN